MNFHAPSQWLQYEPAQLIIPIITPRGVANWMLTPISNRPAKVFGIGLPRTATTSLAAATMELGYITCHTCFNLQLYDDYDAYFDTPFYIEYPELDIRYPGSKFLLTWRDPQNWAKSFENNLLEYHKDIRRPGFSPEDITWDINLRCSDTVFGTIDDNTTAEDLIPHYRHHRMMAEKYFENRPEDFLILNVDTETDPWGTLCGFLKLPVPTQPFPRLNTGLVRDWEELEHVNKRSSYD